MRGPWATRRLVALDDDTVGHSFVPPLDVSIRSSPPGSSGPPLRARAVLGSGGCRCELRGNASGVLEINAGRCGLKAGASNARIGQNAESGAGRCSSGIGWNVPRTAGRRAVLRKASPTRSLLVPAGRRARPRVAEKGSSGSGRGRADVRSNGGMTCEGPHEFPRSERVSR